MGRNTAKRGKTAEEYVANNAQRRTEQRHHSKPKVVKFYTQMKEQAVRWLSVEKWSPEIISVERHKTGKCPMSIESLYQWIWQSKHGNKATDKPYKKMYTHLKHGRRGGKGATGRIAEGLFIIGYLLKSGLKLFRKEVDPVILK